MLRKCACCEVIIGCYGPEKRTCNSCTRSRCPATEQITHGICPPCLHKTLRENSLLSAYDKIALS